MEQGFGLNDCPINTFRAWYQDALTIEQNAGAFTLSTIGLDGSPNSRQLLLKGCDEEGFLFFTNYNSMKGQEIAANPKVALNFYWHNSEKQVRIRATLEKTSEEVSKEYFLSRGRESKIASVISKQSEEIKDRHTLEQEFMAYQESLGDGDVPYPENWGGYLARPYEVTFFIYGEHRLNDRFNYKKEGEKWNIRRLYP